MMVWIVKDRERTPICLKDIIENKYVKTDLRIVPPGGRMAVILDTKNSSSILCLPLEGQERRMSSCILPPRKLLSWILCGS